MKAGDKACGMILLCVLLDSLIKSEFLNKKTEVVIFYSSKSHYQIRMRARCGFLFYFTFLLLIRFAICSSARSTRATREARGSSAGLVAYVDSRCNLFWLRDLFWSIGGAFKPHLFIVFNYHILFSFSVENFFIAINWDFSVARGRPRWGWWELLCGSSSNRKVFFFRGRQRRPDNAIRKRFRHLICQKERFMNLSRTRRRKKTMNRFLFPRAEAAVSEMNAFGESPRLRLLIF